MYRLHQDFKTRGQIVAEEGTVSEGLCFIRSGTVELQVRSKRHRPKKVFGVHDAHEDAFSTATNKVVLTTLGENEFCGESGVLNYYHNTKDRFLEHATTIANSPVELFVLRPADLKMIPKGVLENIDEHHKKRASWHQTRLHQAVVTRKQVQNIVSGSKDEGNDENKNTLQRKVS